jgi:hypothetical protein
MDCVGWGVEVFMEDTLLIEQGYSFKGIKSEYIE